MDGLELVMSQGNCHKRWKIRLMNEFLPSRKAGLNLAGRRWDERGVCQGATRLADPVLNGAELSWSGVMSRNARHEFFMQLTHQPNAERQLLERKASTFPPPPPPPTLPPPFPPPT